MDLQYKYVVRNGDGSVARWMSGDNFSLQTADSDVELPSGLRVSDSWDASVHAVEVREHRSRVPRVVVASTGIAAHLFHPQTPVHSSSQRAVATCGD